MREQSETAPMGRLHRSVAVAATVALATFYLVTLGRPSLWLDEAWEASYYVGIEPQPWYARPVLYMGMIRVLVHLFGPSEFVLRLLPCLAGVAAVAVTWMLLRGERDTRTAWVGAALLAVAPPFLFHAHVLKSYTLDALCAVVLVVVFRAWTRSGRSRLLALHALCAALSFGLSFTAVFVSAALFLIGMVSLRGKGRALFSFALVHVILAVVFAGLYLGFHASAREDPALQAYFVEFYPHGVSPAMLPIWVGRRTLGLLREITGAGSGLTVALLVGAGALRQIRQHRGIVPQVLFSLLLVHAAAAALHLYPYGVVRLSLDLAPLVCGLIACAMTALLSVNAGRGAVAAIAVTGFVYLFLQPSLVAARPYLTTGWRHEHIRGLVRTLAERRRPHEGIYVAEGAAPAFWYYWWRNGMARNDPAIIEGERHRRVPEDHAPQVAAVAARFSRLWTLYTHLPHRERETLRALFERRYDVRETWGTRDAVLDRLERPEGGPR